ncbi:MAG: histidinol-phosphate transaminase [Candidatus Altiarchaeia archaeon]
MKYYLSENVKPWIPGLCCYTPGKTIEGYVKLASNENNYGPSPKVKEAIKKAADAVNIYPYKDPELRKKIAEYCGTKPGNIITGNGSDESIDLIFKTFKGPVLSFNPTYAEYRIFSEALGEKYLQIDLEKDLTFPLKRFIAESSKAKILVLCSPNNPSGGVITEEDLREVLDEGKTTVVDEAYVEFHGKTFTPLVKEYENLIILRTFSKAFALAGLRVGYIIADQKIIELLDRVKPPFSVNDLAIEAALAALDDQKYMRETVAKIVKDRDMIYNALKEKYTTYPSESNFILADVSPRRSVDVYKRLLDKKIIVRNLGKYPGFSGEYIRVSVGTTEENKKFIEALKDI